MCVTLIIINSNKVLVVTFYVQSVIIIIIIPFTCLTVLGGPRGVYGIGLYLNKSHIWAVWHRSVHSKFVISSAWNKSVLK